MSTNIELELQKFPKTIALKDGLKATLRPLRRDDEKDFHALFLGITFGWFYLRTGSVLLCVLAHATANGLSIIATLVQLNIPGLTGTPDFGAVTFQPWWLDLSGLLVFLAGIWGFQHSTARSAMAEPPAPPGLARPGSDEVSDPSRHPV